MEGGWLVGGVLIGPGVPLSERGRSAPLYLGGEPALVQEEIVRVVLQVIAYRILPRGMALTGRPSDGTQDGVGAASGGPPALGR